MRLFIAVEINDAVRDEMRGARATLEAALAGFPRAPRVTWVSPEAAHLTLRFIGEVDDRVATALAEALAAPFDLPSFDVRWQGLGGFPGGRSPRTLWIGAAQGHDALRSLARLVASRVDPIVEADETRGFRAHLTIGRVRDVNRCIDWRQVLSKLQCGPAWSTVVGVTLYRSQLSPRGPTYTALSQVSLA